MTTQPRPAGVCFSIGAQEQAGVWVAWVRGLESLRATGGTEAEARRLCEALLRMSYGRGVEADGRVC